MKAEMGTRQKREKEQKRGRKGISERETSVTKKGKGRQKAVTRGKKTEGGK